MVTRLTEALPYHKPPHLDYGSALLEFGVFAVFLMELDRNSVLPARGFEGRSGQVLNTPWLLLVVNTSGIG